ncbi:MAG TPA: ATP-dependent helicase, partial [Mariniphaga anaerophila]|nr:ATP-dependent helicase [Mariniphaga anaerophila]
YNADALHGDLSQAQRDYVMARFRNKHLQMLVATDVAARGLDVNNLTHIINYNLPDDPEIYIHRSGRTGRAGKKGISVTLIHLREKGKLRQVEKKVNKTFIQKPVPSGKEICEKQLFSLIDKMEKIEVNEAEIDQFMPVIYKKLAWLEREDLIKRFVSLEFNRFLQYYENAPDINVDESRQSKRDYEPMEKGRRGRKTRNDRSDRYHRNDRNDRNDRGQRNERGSRKRSEYEFSRFFFNLGKKNGINKRTIIDLVNEHLPNKSAEIGEIEVMKNFSFFEVDKRYEKQVINAFSKATYKGHKMAIDLARGK